MSARNRLAFQPGVESLDERALAAAGISATVSQGVLTIRGTGGADTIAVRENGGRVTVDGFTGSVDASRITRIQIDGGAGNDRIQVALSSQLTAKTHVHGGSGSDSLTYPPGARFGSFSGFETYYHGPGATGGSSGGGGGTGGGGTGSSTGGGSTGGGWTGGGASGGGTTGNGVRVEWRGDTGPFTVTYYRRGDTDRGGELHGTFQSRTQAEQEVARLQRWAGQINNGGYWDVVRIKVEGHSGGQGSGTTYRALQPGEAIARIDVSGSIVSITGRNGGRLTLNLDEIPRGNGASVPWASYKRYLDQRSPEVWQVHDYLYSREAVARYGLTRAQADDVMLKMMVRRGYESVHLQLVSKGVQAFGWAYYNR